MAAAEQAKDAEVARTAGRGGLAIATAKAYFMVVGLVQQIALPRVLGLDGYGALSSVLSVASIAYNPIVSTSIQGVSRAVAQAPDEQQAQATRGALKIHALLALPFGVIFYLVAAPICNAMGAPHVTVPMQMMSAVLFFYGLYSPFIGVLNGKKRFTWQAGLDMLYGTMRTLALVGGGWWLAKSGRGVEGSSLGFVAASLVIVFIALALVGVGKRGPGGPSIGQHLLFIAPLFVGQAVLNLLLQADLTLLRRFASESARAAGLGPEAADPLVGAYRATQLFSFLPYQLLIAVTFILFPMLATAYRDRDDAAVARYVSSGVRLALILMGLMVSVTSGLSEPLMRLVFPAEAAHLGARAMQTLTLGFGAFAVFGILTTVLNSLKRELWSAIITAVAFGLVVVLCFLRVRGAAFGPELLLRTAMATTAGIVVATVGAGFMVYKTTGAVVAPLSVVRVVAAMAIAITLGRWLPPGGKMMALAYSAVVAGVYVVILLLSRELGKNDLANVKNVISRRRAGPGH
jgi:stage V sporulation protein B